MTRRRPSPPPADTDAWATCAHPRTRTETIPASGGYVNGKAVDTPARVVERCEDCGEVLP